MTSMPKSVAAEICWLSKKEGGRDHPPVQRIRSVAVFEDICPNDSWSVDIILGQQTSENYCYLCNLTIIFDENAPAEIFVQGSKFSLYENKKVANGIILS